MGVRLVKTGAQEVRLVVASITSVPGCRTSSMRRRKHPEALIRQVVYENPVAFLRYESNAEPNVPVPFGAIPSVW